MEINKLINNLINKSSAKEIPAERKQTLQPLVDYIQQKTKEKEAVRLIFICTHNSRRSHLAQVWAQTMAHYFGINNVQCYSAGTEATALFPKVAETLQNSGFEIEKLSESENSIYSIKYADNEPSIIGFSKTLYSTFNPKSEFAAIMTCSQADEGCPFIAGAQQRIPITYDDPKTFDHTPQQNEKYQERSEQIAGEIYWVFSQVKK